MNCTNPQEVWPANKKIIVPCGKCLACLTNRRNDWSFRLMQEYKVAKSAAFITLTYSPKFVPDTGVSKPHFQKFMKRLRKKSGKKLRYYAVGEYGTKTNRPHYHAIIFNYEGNEKFLQSVWPYGIVHIGKVSEASVRYTTKYVIQRIQWPKNSQMARPFSLMSRSYGLGLNYLTDEMVQWHRSNKANHTLQYGIKGRLPRYYKDKIWYRQKCEKAHGGFLIHPHRESIGLQCAYDARKAYRQNLALFYSIYGADAKNKMTEMRNAVISRIKEKVAFTQTL